jgi:hypothetical protein
MTSPAEPETSEQYMAIARRWNLPEGVHIA